MTRGKHNTSAEARRAREGALKAAESAGRDLRLANAKIADQESVIAGLRREVAQGINADLERARTEVEDLRAEVRENRILIKAVATAMRDNYEHAIQCLCAVGFTVRQAMDRVDKKNGFLIEGELLPADSVATHWFAGAKLAKLTKLQSHLSAARESADHADRKAGRAGNPAQRAAYRLLSE